MAEKGYRIDVRRGFRNVVRVKVVPQPQVQDELRCESPVILSKEPEFVHAGLVRRRSKRRRDRARDICQKVRLVLESKRRVLRVASKSADVLVSSAEFERVFSNLASHFLVEAVRASVHVPDFRTARAKAR